MDARRLEQRQQPARGLARAQVALRPAEDADLDRTRRLFGKHHQNTLVSLGDVAILHNLSGDDGAAAPLLEEAVPGLAAALGAEHPDTRYFQGLQTRVRASLREAAAGGESEREQRATRRRRGRA